MKKGGEGGEKEGGGEGEKRWSRGVVCEAVDILLGLGFCTTSHDIINFTFVQTSVFVEP
jgi:hypothetical protein